MQEVQQFTVISGLDMKGVLKPPFRGQSEITIGLSPGTTGHKNPDGSVVFHLKGRTLTVAKPPDHLENHINPV